MAILRTSVTAVSGQLNDQEPGFEFTRWSRNTLITYVSDALIQISSHRPDAFTAPMNVTLVTGVRQKLPPNVATLESVLDNNDPDNPLSVMRDDMGLIRAFNKKMCTNLPDASGNVVYRVSAYSYDPRLPGYFFVSPSVPENMN